MHLPIGLIIGLSLIKAIAVAILFCLDRLGALDGTEAVGFITAISIRK